MTKISTRFALLLAAAAVLPLLAYGAVSIVSLRTGAQQAVILGNLNVARQVAEQIELYVTGSVKILKAVAADLQQTGLAALAAGPHPQELRPAVSGIQGADAPRRQRRGHRLEPSRHARQSACPGSEGVNIEGALISRFSVDDDLLPTAIVAVRLIDRDGGGWLVGRLNLEAMWRMVDRIRVGEQGYALVVTNEGQLLAHGNPDAKSRVARGDNMRDPSAGRAHQRGPARPSRRHPTQYDDERGPMLGVAAHVCRRSAGRSSSSSRGRGVRDSDPPAVAARHRHRRRAASPCSPSATSGATASSIRFSR